MNPIQLISANFEINYDAIKTLEQDRRPATVITIVGPYRSGKSYLLNRIMGNKNDGFPLGSTVQAKTKGIWFWKGDFFGDPSRVLILLDTEGLFDPEKGDATHDMNLFILSILLSSVFIFNTMGTIDARSVDQLHYATEISKFISPESKNDASSDLEKLGEHFPLFIWAVRDHHLRLEIKEKFVSADEYLEFCLQNKAGRSEEIVKYNYLRDAIKVFFPRRSCHVFPAPVLDPVKMRILETLQEDDLSQGFKNAGNKFLAYLQENAKTKNVKTTAITGVSFGPLVINLVDAVLKKNISIESTFKYVTDRANQKASDDAINYVVTKFSSLHEKFPFSRSAFDTHSKEIHLEGCKRFLNAAVSVEQQSEVFVNFEDLVTNTIQEFDVQNTNASAKKCQDLLAFHFRSVEDKAKRGDFMSPGGHALLENEIRGVISKYQQEQKTQELGPEINNILQKYQTEKFVPLLSSTLLADKLLTEQDRNLKQVEMEKKRQEEIARNTRENLERTRKQMSDANEAHERSKVLMETKLRQDHEAKIKELQTEMEKNRIQMEQNHAAGMEQMAEQCRVQTASLQASIVQLQNRPPTIIVKRRVCTIS